MKALNVIKHFFFIVLTFLCVFHDLNAQQKNSVIIDSLFSNVLNEQRNIRIFLPIGYKSETAKTYDVIYALDGETIASLVSQIHNVNVGWGLMPKAIVVGLDNKTLNGVVQRNRDLTPTHMNRFKLSGKADNYVSFIKSELMPYINKNYRTSERNLLFGHSHGGTFAIYTLLREPNLFNTYIAADPSLWWDDEYISKLANKQLDNLSNLNTSLFISGRKGKPYNQMGIAVFDKILKDKDPKKLQWKSVSYENETHITIILKTIYDGLKFSHQDYKK